MAIPKINNYSLTDQVKATNEEYGNRVSWPLVANNAVLLVHDMQKYFVEFYDQQGEPMRSLVQNIQTIIAQCKAAGIPIVYTAQPPHQAPEERALLTDFWGTGLTSENNQHAIVESLKPAADDLVFTKWRYSAFQRTPLHEYMAENNKDQLWIVGVYAHIGILSTALEAFMTDIKAFVVADAVADFSSTEHSMALHYISRRCGRVVALQDIHVATEENKVALASKGANTQQTGSEILNNIAVSVSTALGMAVEELGQDENLFEMGLDSIRLMAIVDVLRENNIEIGFAELAEQPTLKAWAAMLGALPVASAQENRLVTNE